MAEYIERMRQKMTNEEKYKIAAFMIIRNSKVLPEGLKRGKNMKEINQMSRQTLQSVMQMIDFDAAKKLYEEGRKE